MKVSGIVVAGGASKRMGRDKAWVKLDGKPFVEWVIDALRPVCEQVIVVTDRAEGYASLGVQVVGDELPNTGSLGGLYSGLNAAENEMAVAVACDMPFLNRALLQFLITLSSNSDVIIPSVRDERKPERPDKKQDTAKNRNLHPLHAVYNKTCLEPMREAIQRGDLRMISFHAAVRVQVVEPQEIERIDPQHLSFWNVNTPEELKRAEQFIYKQEGVNHA